MIYLFVKVEKNIVFDIDFFYVSVFYFSGDTDKYLIFLQKNILKCCMCLYNKYDEPNFERF